MAAEGLDETWLGRKMDNEMLKELKNKKMVNYAGEGGEYESLVLDCPLFEKKIEILDSKKVMDSKNSGRLIIGKARLTEK